MTGRWPGERGWDGRMDGVCVRDGALELDEGRVFGTFEVREPYRPGGELDRAVPFWNAVTGAGARVVVRARAWRGDAPAGDWVRVATWSRDERGPRDAPAGEVTLDQDTLSYAPPVDAVALAVTLERDGPQIASPRLARIGVTTFRARREPPAPGSAGPATPPRSVRYRSQRVEAPQIALRICGPTSLSMALEYFDVRRSTSDVATAARDPDGAITYGNWAHLAATAAEHGLVGEVVCLESVEELRALLASGALAILSVSFEEGELPQAPVKSTQGHLILATGVDARGRVLVNDPGGHDESDGRVAYDPVPLARAWKRGIAIAIRRP